MTLVLRWHWSHPTTPAGAGWDTVIADSVALAEEKQLSAKAMLGEADMTGIVVDDPSGAYDFKGQHRWYGAEDACRAGLTLTGTLTKASGSATIAGSSTLFSTELVAGDVINVPGGGGADYLTVTVIGSNTSLTVAVAPTHSASGQTASRSPNQLVWNGYVGHQKIGRQAGDGTVELNATGRGWALELVQENTILGFRIIQGAKDATHGDRPAEDAGARLTWLLGSAFLSTVVDHGLIDWTGLATFPMDAVDYRQQTAADLLRDVGLISNFNHYARYHEPSGDIELACYEPNTNTTLDVSTLRLSNVAADLDYVTTFPYEQTSILDRSPDRVAAGIGMAFAAGWTYADRLATSYEFAFRDIVAPSSNVKTLAKAEALRDRLLLQHSTQDETITGVRVSLPAALLNIVKHGQLISYKASHQPGYEDFVPCRVTSKSFSRPSDSSQAVYDVDLELSPLPPLVASYAEMLQNLTDNPHNNDYPHVWEYNQVGFANSVWLAKWDNNGDHPPTGWASTVLSGLLAYQATAAPMSGPYMNVVNSPPIGATIVLGNGIKCLGAGTVDVHVKLVFINAPGPGVTCAIRLNGAIVASVSGVTGAGPGLVDCLGLAVATNDVITVTAQCSGGGFGISWSTTNRNTYFTVSGGLR